MSKPFNIYEFLKTRPLSYSALSAFADPQWGSPEKWYDTYILGKRQTSHEMDFGKKFAESIEAGKPLVPVTVYEDVEYPLRIMFGKIPLIGFIDTFSLKRKALREYKSGKAKWDAARAQNHSQLKMYALCLYVTHKIKPEDLTIHLDWIPTEDTGSFEIKFKEPIKIHSFPVRLTMADILQYGAFINKTVKEMEDYVLAIKD